MALGGATKRAMSDVLSPGFQIGELHLKGKRVLVATIDLDHERAQNLTECREHPSDDEFFQRLGIAVICGVKLQLDVGVGNGIHEKAPMNAFL